MSSSSWWWQRVFGWSSSSTSGAATTKKEEEKEEDVEVIAIGGATRSGKGTLAKALATALELPEWAVVHCDEFFDAEGIFVRHIAALQAAAVGPAYAAACAGDAERTAEARAFAAAAPGTAAVPGALAAFVAADPALCWQDWEAPAAMDWRACSAAVAGAVARARAARVRHVVVEGYTLLQRAWPLAPAVPGCARALFLAVPRATARARRAATKPVPPAYFDARVWPAHVAAHAHLPAAHTDRAWLARRGGDLLVLDGTAAPAALAQTALRFVRHDPALAARDRTPENKLLQDVLGS